MIRMREDAWARLRPGGEGYPRLKVISWAIPRHSATQSVRFSHPNIDEAICSARSVARLTPVATVDA